MYIYTLYIHIHIYIYIYIYIHDKHNSDEKSLEKTSKQVSAYFVQVFSYNKSTM